MNFDKEIMSIARRMHNEAESIYAKMDSRAIQGGAIDDEAETLHKFSKRLTALANKLTEESES